MSKIIMYPHGGSGNHGCEAIVRSTLNIMQQVLPNTFGEKILFSTRIKEDIKVGLDSECKIMNEIETFSTFSFKYILGQIKTKLLGDKDYFDRLAYRNVFNNSDSNTLAISIGGDNYCYGRPGLIYYMNKYIRKSRAKNILWEITVCWAANFGSGDPLIGLGVVGACSLSGYRF